MPPKSKRAASRAPEISKLIRETRERRFEEWALDHPGARKNPYSQEAMAARIGVITQSYNAWEIHREPSLARLRQIARELGMDESTFLVPELKNHNTIQVEELVAQRIAAVTADLDRTIEALERRLALLEAQIKGMPPADEPAAPDRDRTNSSV